MAVARGHPPRGWLPLAQCGVAAGEKREVVSGFLGLPSRLCEKSRRSVVASRSGDTGPAGPSFPPQDGGRHLVPVGAGQRQSGLCAHRGGHARPAGRSRTHHRAGRPGRPGTGMTKGAPRRKRPVQRIFLIFSAPACRAAVAVFAAEVTVPGADGRPLRDGPLL